MLSPHLWLAFLALIPPSFTCLNPFVKFLRPLQPHFSSHNRAKKENSRFNSDASAVLYRKCSHAKQAVPHEMKSHVLSFNQPVKTYRLDLLNPPRGGVNVFPHCIAIVFLTRWRSFPSQVVFLRCFCVTFLPG